MGGKEGKGRLHYPKSREKKHSHVATSIFQHKKQKKSPPWKNTFESNTPAIFAFVHFLVMCYKGVAFFFHSPPPLFFWERDHLPSSRHQTRAFLWTGGGGANKKKERKGEGTTITLDEVQNLYMDGRGKSRNSSLCVYLRWRRRQFHIKQTDF